MRHAHITLKQSVGIVLETSDTLEFQPRVSLSKLGQLENGVSRVGRGRREQK